MSLMDGVEDGLGGRGRERRTVPVGGGSAGSQSSWSGGELNPATALRETNKKKDRITMEDGGNERSFSASDN